MDPVKHDEQREKDVQALAIAVLNANPGYFDNPNGGYEYTCPFCHELTYGSAMKSTEMVDMKHTTDCAYNIAKDLTTKQ